MLVVAGCDSAEVLEPAEHALDQVAALVGLRVVGVGMLARRIGRDHGLGSTLAEPLAQPPGIVGPVCDQAARCRDDRQQVACALQIMRIASGKREGHRPPRMGQRMGGAAASCV